MKIDLYAKKIGQPGHVFLNTFDAPDREEFLLPISPELKATAAASGAVPPVVNVLTRTFRRQSNPLNKALGGNPIFLEI